MPSHFLAVYDSIIRRGISAFDLIDLDEEDGPYVQGVCNTYDLLGKLEIALRAMKP